MKKVHPKFNPIIILSVILLGCIAFSIIRMATATTPNPGHSWTETGDGVFSVTGPTSLRTFTFPDADAIVLTSSIAPTDGFIPFGQSGGTYSPIAITAGSGISIATTSSSFVISGSVATQSWEIDAGSFLAPTTTLSIFISDTSATSTIYNLNTDRLLSGTYIESPYFTATSTTATSTFAYLAVSNDSNLGIVIGGTWQGTPIGDAYLTKSGDWAGTFDSQEGTYYLNAANLTNFGTPFYTFFSATNTDALSQGSTNKYYADSLVRAALSSTATGLTYTSGTGVFSLTSGYEIPTTISTASWNNKWDLASTTIGVAYGGTGATSFTDKRLLAYDGSTLISTSTIYSDSISDVYLFNNADDTTTGQLTAANFVASSASATSTFAGGLAIETSGFVYDYSSGNVGVGTASPTSTLQIKGTNTSNTTYAMQVTDSASANMLAVTNGGSWVGENFQINQNGSTEINVETIDGGGEVFNFGHNITTGAYDGSYFRLYGVGSTAGFEGNIHFNLTVPADELGVPSGVHDVPQFRTYERVQNGSVSVVYSYNTQGTHWLGSTVTYSETPTNTLWLQNGTAPTAGETNAMGIFDDTSGGITNGFHTIDAAGVIGGWGGGILNLGNAASGNGLINPTSDSTRGYLVLDDTNSPQVFIGQDSTITTSADGSNLDILENVAAGTSTIRVRSVSNGVAQLQLLEAGVAGGYVAAGTYGFMVEYDGIGTNNAFTISESHNGVRRNYLYVFKTGNYVSFEDNTIYGSRTSGGNLALGSTQHATKGNITFGTSVYDEVNNRLGIATTSPGATLSVTGTGAFNSWLSADYFLATSTTATSTFAGGFQTDTLDVQSTTATSTFGNGLRVETGGLSLDQLINCNTIDTDASGNLVCGTDEGSAGGQTWELNSFSRLIATTSPLTIEVSDIIATSTTATSTLNMLWANSFQVGDYIESPYFIATSTTASSTFPMIVGGNASGGNLFLGSTLNAAKGKIIFGNSVYDEVNNSLGIGIASPLATLDIATGTQVTAPIGTATADSFRSAHYSTASVSRAGLFLNYDVSTADNTNTAMGFNAFIYKDNAYANTGTTGYLVGRYGFRMTSAATAGNITNAKVIYTEFTPGATYTGTITNAFSIHNDGISIGTGAGIITNAYGIQQDAHNSTGSGVISSAVGAWFEKQTVGAALNAGIVLNGEGTGADLAFTSGTATSSIYQNSGNLILDSDGNIGVGTTTPWRTLSVDGTAAFTSLTNDSTGYYVCLKANGGEMATSTTACGASSIRFKENIEPLSYGLDEVIQFNPVFYNWKKDYISSETKQQIGLIAEDVALITPELVGYDSEGNPLNVDYPKITAVLINSVKELNEKIVGGFDGILDWLGDKIVQAKEFIADKITTKELCIEDVCINKEQLKAMLEQAQIQPIPEPLVSSEVEETPEPPAEEIPLESQPLSE